MRKTRDVIQKPCMVNFKYFWFGEAFVCFSFLTNWRDFKNIHYLDERINFRSVGHIIYRIFSSHYVLWHKSEKGVLNSIATSSNTVQQEQICTVQQQRWGASAHTTGILRVLLSLVSTRWLIWVPGLNMNSQLQRIRCFSQEHHLLQFHPVGPSLVPGPAVL